MATITVLNTNGGNRALVVYYCGEYDVGSFKDVVENVLEINGVLYDESSDAGVDELV